MRNGFRTQGHRIGMHNDFKTAINETNEAGRDPSNIYNLATKTVHFVPINTLIAVQYNVIRRSTL